MLLLRRSQSTVDTLYHSHCYNWDTEVHGGEVTDEHQATAFDLCKGKNLCLLKSVYCATTRVDSITSNKLI